MHLEILVEGQTENIVLSNLLKKIVGQYGRPHTWKIHPHRGIGKIPENPGKPPNKNDHTLLHNLASKLRAYANTMGHDDAVIVLVDLDDRPDCKAFKAELVDLLSYCQHNLAQSMPNTIFRIAIEELEAWFFGDATALLAAYPNAKKNVMNSYEQDSQCGTWEKLADTIYPGGLKSLHSTGKRSQKVLKTKQEWARNIAPHMNIDYNQSPSFQQFRDGVKRLIS